MAIVPVGLLGEARNMILMFGTSESVVVIVCTSRLKLGAGRSGASTIPMSLICAETENISYVGGQYMILSFPSAAKHRMSTSITSLEPSPTKT